jgi:queuine tRNA-ribosyltransferase
VSESPDHEIIRTRAGALAMRSREAGEIMHPGLGPLAEAQALYVGQSRLGERLGEGAHLVVFDVGLGAGSNAVAARAVAERSAGTLELVSFERDLGALELALAHGPAFGFDDESAAAARALLAHGRHQTAHTLWRLVRGDARETLAEQAVPADVLFWDPYSSRVNPALWNIEAFALARRMAGPRATLYTYSASTAVRVAMLLGGWWVGVGAGSGSKAHTTAAAAVAADLAAPLDGRWLQRLSHPGAPLPADAPADVVARVAALPQFRASTGL